MHRSLLAAPIALVCTLPACTQLSNSQRYALANDLYITSVETMTNLSKAGKLTVSQMDEFEALRAPTSALLKDWQFAINNKQPFDSRAALDALLDRLIEKSASLSR